jgi:hypothetical protein
MAWQVEPAGEGLSQLTVTTSRMGAKTADSFVGGVVYIVSGLKTYVETGAPMAAATG